MAKITLWILLGIHLCATVTLCQAIKDETDSGENQADKDRLKTNNPFLQKALSYRRIRRQSEGSIPNIDTASTVLSILPLDRIGSILGQIMSTGLKEMFNPNVGKKIVDVLENQGPLLLTSLFSNLFTTLALPGGVPPRPNSPSSSAPSSSAVRNTNIPPQLSNGSVSNIMDAIRRPAAK